ncbi:MAG: matrixin family metalloprotease [Streptosporangiales bacterium]|nr:matrixin family metalloprotease [Streptosporangiales bacterium]
MFRVRIGRVGLGLALVFTALTLPAAATSKASGSPEREARQTRSLACHGSTMLRAVRLPSALEPVCDLVGRKIMDEGGVGAHVPPPGWGVAVNALTLTGEQVFAIETRADRSVLLLDVGLERSDQEAATASQSAATAGAACRDGAWRNRGVSERDNHRWRFNPAHRPSGLSVSAARRAIAAGRGYFADQHNDCGYAAVEGANAPTITYRGTTSRAPGIGADGACSRHDGVNVVGFGSLRRTSAIASTCYWYVRREIRESDAKLGRTNARWTTSPGRRCTRAMDIASVMAHETGHTFGLSHPRGSHPSLTMNGRIPACSKAFRTLGRGDIRGIRAKYGG